MFDNSTQSNAAHAGGESPRIILASIYTGEVDGLYQDGVIFKWHQDHDDAQEIHAAAKFPALSQDAKCIATGDSNGIVKLFSIADSGLVYQFCLSRPISLTFALLRIHALSTMFAASHSNVWEPNASESAELSGMALVWNS